MTTKNSIPAVNEKDTKGAIIEKFNQVVEMLKAKDAAKLDPAKEVAQKAVISILEKTDTVVKADVGTQINSMITVVTDALNSSLAQINTRVIEYTNLDEAIKLKKDEIKELFDIEASAYALIALINMQEDQKTIFDATMVERKEKVNADLQAIIVETQERRAAFQAEATQARKDLDANRKREEEEYKYNRDRTRKLENDKVEDDKATRLKEFNEELAARLAALETFKETLDKRAEEVTAKEDIVKDLQAKVKSIPGQIEAAIAKATKDSEAASSKSFGFQKMLLEKDLSGEKKLFETRIETLETNLADEKIRSSELARKLDEAYAKIENISGKAVDAAAGTRYIDRIEGMAKEQGKTSTVK